MATLPASQPADFSLGVTVYGDEDALSDDGQTPARYIVEPSGWLLAGVGDGASAGVYPARAAWLDAARRAELWNMVRSSGIVEIEAPLRVRGVEGFEASLPTDMRAYLVELTGAGGRWIVAMPGSDPAAEPFIEIADQLAAWAWVKTE